MASSPEPPVLELRGVARTYTARGETLAVLRDVDLSLARGHSAVIMGPSGSGKSTLLNIIGSLDRPSGGHVRLGGEDPFALDDTQLAAFRNRRIGFVFQDHHVLPQCTVLENVLIPALAETGAPDRSARARRLLERVGLPDRLDSFPAELSGGQRQRVAIARALINEPQLVLADEPTGNLDHDTAGEVGDLLAELTQSEGLTLVVVTHDAAFARRFGRLYRLEQGRLVASAEAAG